MEQPPAPPQVQPRPEAQVETTPVPQGRWIHTDEYGSVWIPRRPRQPIANGPVSVPKTLEQPAANGQWVYTAQYGWIWMPYGIQYVYEPPAEGAYPQAFVYHPMYGWRWVLAPWVWGWGLVPFYGSNGPWPFAWYRGPTYVHAGWRRAGYPGGATNPVGGMQRAR